MPKSRGTRLVILCEDLQQEVFARHYFLLRGFHRREISSVIAPQGRGAGEQFVRERFAVEVREQRRQVTHQSVALVVLIDADTQPVHQRKNTLDNTLQSSGQVTRRADERIAIVVPKRNIETWIAYPNDPLVNETHIYPKLVKETDCLPAVRIFVARICRQGLPQEALVSLQDACIELRRIIP